MNRQADKMKSKKGFTLIEMLVTIVILLVLTAAMGTGISTALRVYQQAIFHSNSASLAYILDTSMEDVLRYSEQIYTRGEGETDFTWNGRVIEGAAISNDVNFLFTNREYGAQNAYFYFVEDNAEDTDDENMQSPIRMRNVFGGQARDLVNNGSYPMLAVKDFRVWYTEADGMFHYKYIIVSRQNAEMTRPVEGQVRAVN